MFTTHDEPVEHVRRFSHSPMSVRGHANGGGMCTNALNRQRNINYCVCLEEKGAAMKRLGIIPPIKTHGWCWYVSGD